MSRGYFEIGIFEPKTGVNVGSLWRSAFLMGASGIFTIGKRYHHQATDTAKTERSIPLRQYRNFEEFFLALPVGCSLIGIEQGARPLKSFVHPERCIYLLGAEDYGLPHNILNACNILVSLEAKQKFSYNVAVAGSIVMYHRAFL